MPEITIYSKDFCPYCDRAKLLLKKKGVGFNEIDIQASPQERESMIEKSGGRMTVPQIFIDDHHVGGYDDLAALDRAGDLDSLLNK